MKNTLAILGITGVAIALSACAPRATDLPPGQYEKTTVSRDAQGTKTTTSTSTDVYYDEHGNKKAVTETEAERDPRGLFNKSTHTKREVEYE